jgi:fructose 1,6-bisphosphatase
VTPHDAPSAGELIEAVREWIERDVLAATEGRLQYHARVAINVLSIVERELTLGESQHAAHADRLRVLGVGDDAALAAAIRSGELDDRMDEVRALVWQSVRDKLAVANPKYLSSP